MLATARIIMDEYMLRGRLEECLIGLEYVGIDSAGCRVMGIWENRYVIVTYTQLILAKNHTRKYAI